MAQVVEAVACGLDGFERRVAIKRLLPEHAGSDERRRMFFEEARIGSRLHHGGIVSIFDYGLIDGSEFLAMDFVDGLDTLRAVKGASAEVVPMSEGIALHVVAEIGHALAYVHDLRDENGRVLGIVHRDVSPPNILLSWDGDVKLCDFGIALSARRPRDEQTMGGAVKGKLHYMAPEQARGERVTTAADVYALGATLDALLGGGALAPVRSDTSGDARAAEARGRGVSPAVADLIRACLTREPASRPTAAEVAVRAGTLASPRLDGDGRSALCAWLRPLRALTLRRSKLDDLMGLCLVQVGAPEARSLTVTTIERGTRPTARARAERWQEAGGRTKTVLMSGALAIAAIALGLGAGRVIHHLRGKGAIAAPLERTDLDPAPAPAARTPPAPAPPTIDPSPTIEPSSTSHPAESVAPSTFAEHPPETARPHRGLGASPPRLEAARPGWLRVGGAELAGARVTIDHLSVGFAPLELELLSGAHTVVVTAPGSGRVLVRTTVRVSPDSTRAAPARVLR
jgi:serine/threonine-protein kinase